MKIEEIYREIIKIHSILDNYHNQLNANKEKFEKIYNETISSTTETRNMILTVITAFFGLSGFSVAIQNTTDSTNTTDSSQLIKLILSPSMLFYCRWSSWSICILSFLSSNKEPKEDIIGDSQGIP